MNKEMKPFLDRDADLLMVINKELAKFIKTI